MGDTGLVIKEIVAGIRTDPSLVSTLPHDADLLGDVGLDSLELMQFLLEVEARLGIVIDFEHLEYDDLSSTGRLARFFEAMPKRAA